MLPVYGVDRTEIDLTLGNRFIEAKLTESAFQTSAARASSRQRDLAVAQPLGCPIHRSLIAKGLLLFDVNIRVQQLRMNHKSKNSEDWELLATIPFWLDVRCSLVSPSSAVDNNQNEARHVSGRRFTAPSSGGEIVKIRGFLANRWTR